MIKPFSKNNEENQSKEKQLELLSYAPSINANAILAGEYDAIRIVDDVVLVLKGNKCGIVDSQGEVKVRINKSAIIQPYQCTSSLFCIKESSGAWTVLDSTWKEKFSCEGIYYMWGFDHDFCLVRSGTDKITFKDRAIIDSEGRYVVPFNKYTSIWTFYADGKSVITAELDEMKYYLSKNDPSKVVKKEYNVVNKNG